MKRSITRSIIAAGTLALAVAGGSRALAHGMGGDGGSGHGAFFGGGRMLHALDLRADQQQQVHDIMSAHRSTFAQLAANERASREAIADKLAGTAAVTLQDLDALLQQESQARTALMRARLATALEVRSVLDPGQIQKGASLHASMKQLHQQMRQLLGGQAAD